MAANKKLLILPGDGIGLEVSARFAGPIHWLGKRRAVAFEVEEALVGRAAIDKEGLPVRAFRCAAQMIISTGYRPASTACLSVFRS